MTQKTAVLLMAYGTPRTPAEIEPYYTDIRRGRAPTPEQLADLIARYDAIGGISPLAARTEAQRDALQKALDAIAPDTYEVVLGLKLQSMIWQLAVFNTSSGWYLHRTTHHSRSANTWAVPALPPSHMA